MQSRLYLDASILIPPLVEEDTFATVHARFYGTRDELIVSDLAIAEVSTTKRSEATLVSFDWRLSRAAHMIGLPLEVVQDA